MHLEVLFYEATNIFFNLYSATQQACTIFSGNVMITFFINIVIKNQVHYTEKPPIIVSHIPNDCKELS